MHRLRLLAITHPAFDDDAICAAVEKIAGAVPPFAFGVQLRDKERPREVVRAFAERLREVTSRASARLVVNGDAELAAAVGADGVHLGGGAISIADARRVCSGAWVSIASHTDAAVRAAIDEGADAVLVSPIFLTRTPVAKSEVRVRVQADTPIEKTPRGLGALRSARALVDEAGAKVAVFALGGVTPENARDCVASGADGIAVIRSLFASEHPDEDARAFCGALGV